MEPGARIGARLRARRGNAGYRPATRLRYESRGGNHHGQQDRARPDRRRIAGGSDTAAIAHRVSARFQQRLLAKLSRQDGRRSFAPWLGLRFKHLRPVLPGVAEPRTGMSMGDHCELMAKEWNISREDQDSLRWPAIRKPPQPTSAVLQGSGRALPRPGPRQLPARGHDAGKTRGAEARVRQDFRSRAR